MNIYYLTQFLSVRNLEAASLVDSRISEDVTVKLSARAAVIWRLDWGSVIGVPSLYLAMSLRGISFFLLNTVQRKKA